MDSLYLRSSVLHIFHNVDFVKRQLQQNSGNASEKNESQDKAYEIIAFLLWYIFLVLCCVVPTCCVYRRCRANTATAQQVENPERPMPSSAPESELEISPVAAATIVDSNDNSEHRNQYTEI
jgi:hypothetical protein